MTQIQDLTKKIADFFTGEDFYENGESAKLVLSVDDARLISRLITDRKDKLRGEWIGLSGIDDNHGFPFKCSVCGNKIYSHNGDDLEVEHAYCGSCGAKMKIGKHESNVENCEVL